MKSYRIILFNLIILLPSLIFAQKEASVWPVGNGKQINFQSGNFEFYDFTGNPNASASICDKNGNLVLYTDGRTIWNKNHEIVVNGEMLIPQDAFQENRPVFVPYPKKEGWYILIYDEWFYNNNSKLISSSLYYAEINTKAKNNVGEVVRQKIKIHDNYHSGPTIAGFCDNSYYWLVIDRNDNTIIDESIDRIYSYKIDENGVNAKPVINDYFDIGNSNGYRFSPGGDKFFFMFGGNSVDRMIITDFNFKTGELYNYRVIDFEYIWQKEFSPDSKLMYFFDKGNLIQLDVSFLNSILIMNSADTIMTLETDTDNPYPLQDLRLGPDGKIYFYYSDVNVRKPKLGRINQPNKKGNACDVELNYLTLDSYEFRFPEFVTSFFRDKNPEIMDEVIPDAGPALKICAGFSMTIGFEETTKAFYNWTPASDLSEPLASQTVFSPPKYYGLPKTDPFILRATDGNCWVNFDTTFITLNPIPHNLPVDGSWSVCPFVEEVDYLTVDDRNKLQWLVDGGEIVSNSANDSVKINWGESNMKASASVFSVNQYGCSSDTSVFPVRINVELITETPKGPDKLCIAESTNIEYEIRNTNGSVYEWFPERGKVVFGQGTNKVVVSWFGDGIHKLSVEETSVTIDTVCFGESEPLMVNVVNDSLSIELYEVSFNPDNLLVIRYLSENFQKTHQLFLIIQNKNGQDIDEILVNSLNNGEITYMPVGYNYNSEIINLKVKNNCNEIFYSNPQQTITVNGKEDVTGNGIQLDWNSNLFWENDRLEHEIWHSTNGTDGWKKVASGITENEYHYNPQELSLSHFFRINEINLDKNQESWSNKIQIVVNDDLIIPDVFTPNADGINDEWEIRNIQFHPFQQAVIYNRYGQVIYECKNEFIPWDGRINGEIIQGTYLYQVTFDTENVKYGQVTVLR